MIKFPNMREITPHLTKDEWLFTGFSTCHQIAKLFLGTFVVSFLMHNSINEIISVSAYRLFYYFAICMTFILSATWCKLGNKTTLFGMNIVTRMILLGLIAILGTRAADYVILLGMLYGIFDGFYNLPMYEMIIEKVPHKRMVFFLGTKTAIKNTFKILVPVILGYFITTKSLQNTAWVMVVMTIIEIFMLFLLSPSKQTSANPVNFIGFYKTLKHNSTILKQYFAESLCSFADILETLVTMYIVYVFFTDMNLGIWTTIFSICTIVASWAFGRFCTRRDYKWVMWVCSLLLLSTTLFLYLNVNHFSTLAYAFASTVCLEILSQISGANSLNMAKTKFVSSEYCTEYLVGRSIVMFIGRWVAFVLLMYIGVFGLKSILGLFMMLAVFAKIYGSLISANLTEEISKQIK